MSEIESASQVESVQFNVIPGMPHPNAWKAFRALHPGISELREWSGDKLAKEL